MELHRSFNCASENRSDLPGQLSREGFSPAAFAWKSKAKVTLVPQIPFVLRISRSGGRARDVTFASEGWVAGNGVYKQFYTLEICTEIPPSKCGVGPRSP